MRHCIKCGVYRSDQYRLGALILEDAPPAAFWRGRQLDLRPTHIAILIRLIRAPIASVPDLEHSVDRRMTNQSLRVQIRTLRMRLPSEIKIETVYGQGYSIVVDGKRPEVLAASPVTMPR